MNNSILVSIASYKDVDVINTIVDLYDKAEFPYRVSVALFLQDTPEEISRICFFFSNFLFKANIKIKTIPFEEAKGCGWARNIILKELYDDEDYFMCVDSHSRFLKKWDSVYIDIHKQAPVNSVISAFPQPFDFNETYEQYSKRNITTIYTPDKLPLTNDFTYCQKPTTERYENVMSISGGNIFGDSKLPKAITLDDYTFLHNKEQEVYSLLIYLYGLDIYAVPQNIVWHKYIVNDSYRELFSPKQIKYNTDFINTLKTKETNRTVKGWVDLIQRDCDECKKTKQLNS
jgi:Glycosyltransferase (GlcNAc)